MAARRKRKQTEIPGTERQVDQELSDAADKLQGIRAKRMDLQRKEATAQEELLELMKTRKLDTYIDEDLELRVLVKHGEDKVSVTKIKPKADAAE